MQTREAALQHFQAGRLAEAAGILQAALEAVSPGSPDAADVLNDLGSVLLAQQRFEAALDCYRRAEAIRPDDAMILYNHGNALYAAQRYGDAVELYRRALAVSPDFAELHNNLGNALRQVGQLHAAVESYRHAIELQPDQVTAQGNLGRTLCQLGRAEAAVECHRAVVAARPADADALIDLADALAMARRFAEADQTYRRALQHGPENTKAIVGLATALSGRDRHEEALLYLDRALKLQPGLGEALVAVGNALVGLNRHEDALAVYRAAEPKLPGSTELQVNLCLALLATGAWREGWRRHEIRLSMPRLLQLELFPPDIPQWRGETDLAGKTILLQSEQGLGDTLQFVRYVPLVAARGARVVLRVERPLRRLLVTLPGADSVITWDDPVPPVDLQCPLMSLPLAFNTELDSVPAATPYLHASPVRQADWLARLGPRARPRIGLAWWGRQHIPLRSLPLATLAPLLQRQEFEFHALQPEIRDEDRHLVIDHSAALQDFADTAALASCMDLVISIDTSVAHLAGALGLPTWVLLPFSADCRWLRGRDDSPWYPTMRLFRQPERGDWAGVVAAVIRALDRN